MKAWILSCLRSIAGEAAVIFCLIILINNYLGNQEKRINADGIGYYDYLPAIFIHHDIDRKGEPRHENPDLYARIAATGVYVDYDSVYKVNKYPCGTALLQLPFFLYPYITQERTGENNDGYQEPYQKAVFHAALFYLLFSLFFLKRLLRLYRVHPYVIFFSQLLLGLGTAVTHYVNYDAAFSHIYSLFAITAFLFFVKSFFETGSMARFTWACAFLGLIIILRQVNVLVVFFVPFLAGSYGNLKNSIGQVLQNFRKAVPGIGLMCALIAIQCLLWYLQTGRFIVYSYQGEGFNFRDPQILNVLFSYRKGLFVYTPVLLLALGGLIWLLHRREGYLLITWLGFFLLLTYVLSSWHAWWYGCSYGQRPFIDFYAAFFIPIALMLDRARLGLKVPLILAAAITVPLNLIQTYQYSVYILHWIDMDKDKYWKVFLKQDDIYRGLVWKKSYNYNWYAVVKEIELPDFTAEPNRESLLIQLDSTQTGDFSRVSIIQLSFENEFSDQDSTKIVLSIDDPDRSKNNYYHNPWLMHFTEEAPNAFHRGLYNYEFSPVQPGKKQVVTLIVQTRGKPAMLKKPRIKFLALS